MRDIIQFLLVCICTVFGTVFLLGVVVGMVFRANTPAPGPRRGVAMPTGTGTGAHKARYTYN